ncbi:histidine kinase [Paucibacter sp. AS339]|uniref:sensor histidine kinase n=1 Tax=Paucibacter hankyongi TaxID=3133434 RepID=UPI0030976FCB
MSLALPPRQAMRAAFFSVMNLRVVAAMLGLGMLIAVARGLTWFLSDADADLWQRAGAFLRLLPLGLLPVFGLLVAAAITEALLAWRRTLWPERRHEWAWRGLALVLATALALFLRHGLLQLIWGPQPFYWGFFFSRLALYSLFAGLAYALLRLLIDEGATQQRLAQARGQREALRTQQMEAQMQVLNAQIEPHFLFNSLATARRLLETTPGRGREMLSSLIAYLQAALPAMRESQSSLAQELDLVRNYLRILQMRMGERLRFDIEADPALRELMLPPLVLATLVENAIKHGVGPLPEGGTIKILARLHHAGGRGREAVLDVQDSGCGFGQGQTLHGAAGTGVGLANTKARLQAFFGPQAALELEPVQPHGLLVRLRCPLPMDWPARAERSA